MDEQKPRTSGTPPEVSSMNKGPQSSHLSQQEPGLRRPHFSETIFLGPQGLRVVWRVLLFLSFGILIFVIERSVLAVSLGHAHLGLWVYIIGESVSGVETSRSETTFAKPPSTLSSLMVPLVFVLASLGSV